MTHYISNRSTGKQVPVSPQDPLPVSVGASSINVTAFGYPTGAVPLTSSSGNKANQNAVATLASNADGTTVYITGFEVTGLGATTGVAVVATVVGLKGGTASYVFPVPAGVLVGAAPLVVEFPLPIPASGANVDIVVTAPAFGSGNTNAAVVAHGYRV